MPRIPRVLMTTTFSMLCLGATCLATSAEPLVRHVAVNGNDQAAGTEKAPFRTLTRARDAVRTLKARGGLPPGGARVLIHGGIYRLAEPFVLGPEDSGTPQAPIVYAAAPGTRPVLSGGRVISGLRRNADGSWSTTVAAAAGHQWVFRELFVDGRRYIPARSPNEGQYFIARGVPVEGGASTAKDRFVFQKGDLQPWPNLADVELLLTFSWNTGTFPVKAVDPQTRVVTLGGPACWPLPGWVNTCYIVQNHPGACDAPGEWQLNRETGELRVIPFGNEDLGAAEVVAPTFERLMIAQGVPAEGRYVEHVRLEGLAFQHASWDLPPQGFSTPQAACALGAAVEFQATRHCVVTDCEIAHVGRYGLSFDRDCSYNTIQRNHLYDLGGGGLRLGTTDPPQPVERLAHHNLVDNNFIHDGGHTNPGAPGIYMPFGSYNTFSHNEVSDLRYTGISLGWSWDFAYSGTRENIVEYNNVHDVMRTLEDGAAVYSLGLTPGSVIRHNVLHHVGTPPEAIGDGIQVDGGGSGLLVENNIFHDCGSGGIRVQHGDSCITVLNNISAFSGEYGLGIDSERTNIFQYNIVYLDGKATPFRYLPKWQSYDKIIDYNLYWRADDKPIEFLGFTWDEWRKIEGLKDVWYTPCMDAHSRMADPLFVDAAKRDFRLQPNSPALALGFRPIDTSGVGLSGDQAWTSLPASYPLPPLLPHERNLHLRSWLPEDDFDDGLPGQKPAGATVVEDVKGGAYVEISDRRALSAPHSLRFVDAPNLTDYMPHIYYSLNLVGDVIVRLDFDLYREPGAVLWTEWREKPGYAKVGPCLTIEKDGQLLLNERRPTQTRLPAGEWLHFAITDGLGRFADAKWNLTITDQSGKVLFEGKDLPCAPEFDRIKWLGFVSNGTEAAEMYLDNVVMRRVGP